LASNGLPQRPAAEISASRPTGIPPAANRRAAQAGCPNRTIGNPRNLELFSLPVGQNRIRMESERRPSGRERGMVRFGSRRIRPGRSSFSRPSTRVSFPPPLSRETFCPVQAYVSSGGQVCQL